MYSLIAVSTRRASHRCVLSRVARRILQHDTIGRYARIDEECAYVFDGGLNPSQQVGRATGEDNLRFGKTARERHGLGQLIGSLVERQRSPRSRDARLFETTENNDAVDLAAQINNRRSRKTLFQRPNEDVAQR